jgi:hypothetical protein
LIQSVEELRQHFNIRVETFNEEEEEIEEKRILQALMSGEYPDAEIDKLIETFTMSGF